MKIVALVPGSLEDQIFFFPTLDELRQLYPSAEIDVVVEPRSRDAYRVSKAVNATIPFDFQDNNSPADWANLLGILRDRSYNLALTLNQSGAAGLLLWLAGIPQRVGYAEGSRWFLSTTVPYKADQYRPEVYYDLLTAASQPCPEIAISLARKDLDWADGEQKRLGLAGGGYVLFYDAATDGRTYPVESWQAIAQDFQKKQPSLPLVVLQDNTNASWVRSLTQVCPTLTVATPSHIGQQAAFIAGANLMLCTPSVPLQLAVALKVYTLGLFGSDNPTQLLPQSDKFLGIPAPNGNLSDLAPTLVLQKVWGS